MPSLHFEYDFCLIFILKQEQLIQCKYYCIHVMYHNQLPKTFVYLRYVFMLYNGNM